ncbi:expressed protein (plasmid) [Thermomicrobium roseum DSM 5159]|uniref:Expressed protein n=1 Tax=Thermomicrobium roseum (strain ATCC 27502 / DSM 5159 / P-2) TaxID=309801 RepID=B9L575_THERP|nr:expressed protein [Thermomicrobium roseum DSM 5159]
MRPAASTSPRVALLAAGADAPDRTTGARAESRAATPRGKDVEPTRAARARKSSGEGQASAPWLGSRRGLARWMARRDQVDERDSRTLGRGTQAGGRSK